ncbi:sensor domain-containing diguanylate cyclase [Sulfurivermis fontis]|uniref:sensor domain-containing diguanylate cyclase n=1 Tax=Sulfurivermis fontis TaxID=1972068 RepID=UPI000FD951C2|nr:sensor domain-containing diguanylate cyclase [Sulfurivermis fontis]
MDTAPFIETFRELNDSFLKLIDSLSALRGLSALRVYGQSDSQLLGSALDVLMQNQDMERCSVYLLRDGKLVNAAGLDWADMIGLTQERSSGHAPLFASFEVGEGLVGMAAQTGLLQHSRNCENDPRFARNCRGISPAAMTIGSLISLPIKASGEVLGVLNVSHPHAEFFTEAQERSLVIFANFLGQMLVNNRLLNSMENMVRERTRQLEQALADAEALKRRYAELSVIDELTGLHNRRFFFPESRSALARSLRYKKGFCLLLLDIDHFKGINDVHGHNLGDEVLRRCAELLRQQVREVDVLARFGGEEFIIAVPDTELEGAKQLAERIRAAVKDTEFNIDGRRIKVTVSIGIACLLAQDKADAQIILERLISEADQALYFGKHNGRDKACAYPEIACFL